jgi:hypothetical protein
MEERKDTSEVQKTAITSQYVGSFTNEEIENKKKKKREATKPNRPGRFTGEWPTRRARRKMASKLSCGRQYRFTEEELKVLHQNNEAPDKFAKMCEVMRGNTERGKMLVESYNNEIVHEDMLEEQAREARCQASLIEAFGQKLGMEKYRANRKLQGYMFDKKMGAV